MCREFRTRCAVLVFFCASARLVLRFDTWEEHTFIYHLVAASIPKDRLRAEERHPRKILGSYDTNIFVVDEVEAQSLFAEQADDCLWYLNTWPVDACVGIVNDSYLDDLEEIEEV